MEFAACTGNVIPIPYSSLTETIAKLGLEFSNMKIKLRDAHFEITKLRGELANRRRQHRVIPKIDVNALRRRVAYYCHPDRGGDTDLMSKLNALFDFLETFEDKKGRSES